MYRTSANRFYHRAFHPRSGGIHPPAEDLWRNQNSGCAHRAPLAPQPAVHRETLPDALKAASIGYVHIQGLGGLRHARVDSRNMAWRNASFRGFADYMQTDEFAENLEWLIDQHAHKSESIGSDSIDS